MTQEYIWKKRKENNTSERYMYSSAHDSTIYNRQDMEDEWIKKLCYTHTHTHTYTHTMEYYSAIKNSEIVPFAATWMDLEGIVLSKRQILYFITNMWNLKNKIS